MDRLDGMNVPQALFFFFLFQELYFEEVSECQYIEKFIRILKDSKVSKNSPALNDISHFLLAS